MITYINVPKEFYDKRKYHLLCFIYIVLLYHHIALISVSQSVEKFRRN